MKLPRNLDHLVESGRHNLEGLVDEGRKGASRLYADSRGWLEDHLPDRPDTRELRRSAERGRDRVERAGRAALHRAGDDNRLRAPVRWIEAHLPEPRRSSSVLLPSVLAAAGAGVAFWWWTSWSRGRAEAAERAALDAAGGAEGKAHPESVTAHAPEPAGAPVNAPDASAGKLAEPAEELMAHTPPPSAGGAAGGGPAGGAGQGATEQGATGAGKGKATADEARLLASTAAAGLAGGVEGVAPEGAVKSLDESLAVQGSAKAPKASGSGKANGGGKAGGAAI